MQPLFPWYLNRIWKEMKCKMVKTRRYCIFILLIDSKQKKFLKRKGKNMMQVNNCEYSTKFHWKWRKSNIAFILNTQAQMTIKSASIMLFHILHQHIHRELLDLPTGRNLHSLKSISNDFQIFVYISVKAKP